MQKQTYIPNICSIFFLKSIDMQTVVLYYVLRTVVRNICSGSNTKDYLTSTGGMFHEY